MVEAGYGTFMKWTPIREIWGYARCCDEAETTGRMKIGVWEGAEMDRMGGVWQ